MKLFEAKYAFCFDDMMLVPQYSEVKSRKLPDVSTTIGSLKLDIPIVSAPMNTITEYKMMEAMSILGGSSVLHRYMSMQDHWEHCLKSVQSKSKNFFVALGATGDFLERAFRLYDLLGIANFCIDVANGHSKICLDAVEKLANKIPNSNIMAGNVCTYNGASRLINSGAGIIRCGTGGGSVCKTRIVTGYGVPQLTAIEECVRAAKEFDDVSVVADGGIRNSGDIVKALAVGADAVMCGNLLAGTAETPGKIYSEDGYIWGGDEGPSDRKKYHKKYAGMASEEGRKFNGWFTEEDASFIPEGESIKVPYKGPVKNVIDNLVGGLKVGMSYAGAMNIKELQQNAQWVRISENGRIEGMPHAKK